MGTIENFNKLTICTVLFSLYAIQMISSQRVVPGVNPQHYQQVPVQQQQQYQQQHPPPQQYQQQPHLAPGVNPQQYQQVPQQQYQQAPPVHQQAQPQQVQQQQMHQGQQQQQQQPQQVHQQAPQAHHGQHAPHGQPQQVLHAGNMEHERAHIQEHMQVPIDTSKMSEAELQFHYFKMHDSDNNNKLDGCELIKSLIHWHADEEKNPKPKTAGTGEKDGTIYTDQGLADVIDYVLKTMDFNNDGFVDYAEYRKSEEGTPKGTKT